jgi:hypothetical protein
LDGNGHGRAKRLVHGEQSLALGSVIRLLVQGWFGDFPAIRQGRPLSNLLFWTSLSDPDRVRQLDALMFREDEQLYYVQKNRPTGRASGWKGSSVRDFHRSIGRASRTWLKPKI